MPRSKVKKRALSGPKHSSKRLKSPNTQRGSSTKGAKKPPSGHEPFAKLPIELRINIWASALTCETAVAPAQQRVGGNIFVVNEFETPAAKEIVNTLKAISRTCRLFADDQKAYPTFYEVNAFHFSEPSELIAYAASITPSKLSAIKNITISTQIRDSLGERAVTRDIFGPLLEPLILYKGLERLELSFVGDDSSVIYELPEGRETHLVGSHERVTFGTERLELTLGQVVAGLPSLQVIGLKGFARYDHVDVDGTETIRGARFDSLVAAQGFTFKDSHAAEAFQKAEGAFTVKDDSKSYAEDEKIQVEGYVINWLSGVHQALQGSRVIHPETKAAMERNRQSLFDNVLVDILGQDRLTLKDKHSRSVAVDGTRVQPNEFGQTITRGDMPKLMDLSFSKLLWYPCSEVRLEAGRPCIYIFGEGMNPPFTLAERQRVAEEFKDCPKVRKNLDLVKMRFTKEVCFVYLKDIARWCWRNLKEWQRKSRNDPTLTPPLNPRAIFGPLGFCRNLEDYRSMTGFQALKDMADEIFRLWEDVAAS